MEQLNVGGVGITSGEVIPDACCAAAEADHRNGKGGALEAHYRMRKGHNVKTQQF